jgi:LPXTG-motif cell wall-anchored protein
LRLTAHLEVPLNGGHVVTHEISVTIVVKRTLAYTLGEIATHWATWSGIGASMVGLLGWVAARRRRNRLDAIATKSI